MEEGLKAVGHRKRLGDQEDLVHKALYRVAQLLLLAGEGARGDADHGMHARPWGGGRLDPRESQQVAQ
jgi:hypothetical protein